ncbi:MAG: hypothetical protein HKN32_05780, partial [Flavobacteriales bacterium]|nr:hypothetical protein [Flavobacteriales bacterium]
MIFPIAHLDENYCSIHKSFGILQCTFNPTAMFRFTTHSIFTLALFVLLVQCNNAEQATQTSEPIRDFSQAEANYAEYCSGCHGAKMRAFVDRTWTNGREREDLIRSIADGIIDGGMPAYDTTFTATEVSDLADYILTGIQDRAIHDIGAVVTPTYYETQHLTLRADTVVSDIEIPWGIEVTSDGTIYFTERKGTLNRCSPNGDVVEIPGTPEVMTGNQDGMLDVALHPDFATNQVLYLSYSKINPQNDEESTTAVIRAKLVNDELTEITEIFEALPYSTMHHHYGCRLVFDKEGYLFLTVGDRGARDVNPQSLDNHCGKVHRIHDDGSIP